MMNESNCLTPPPRLYRITSFTKLKSWEQQTQEELGSIEVTMSDSSSMGQTSMAQPFGITVSSEHGPDVFTPQCSKISSPYIFII